MLLLVLRRFFFISSSEILGICNSQIIRDDCAIGLTPGVNQSTQVKELIVLRKD
jgi:hypothetical protein